LIRRNPLAATLLLTGIVTVTATPAFAAGTVEAQVAATSLLPLLGAAITGSIPSSAAELGPTANLDLCLDSIPCPDGNGTCMVDHVQLTGGGVLEQVPVDASQTIPKGAALALLPVTVALARQACFGEAGCPGVSPMAASLEVDLFAKDGQLCAKHVGFEPNPFGWSGPSPDVCLPMDLSGAVRSIIGPGAKVTGQSVAVNSALDRVALRLEYAGGGGSAAWSSFVTGSLAPGATTSGWSVFVDEGSIRSHVAATFAEAFKKEGLFVEKTWSKWKAALSPHVEVSVAAEVPVPACPDIGVDVNVEMALSLAPGGTAVALNGSFSKNVDNGDVLACVLLGGPPTDPTVVTTNLLLAGVLAAGFEPESPSGSMCSVSGSNVSCSAPFPLPALLAADTLFGVSSGLVVGGPLPVLPMISGAGAPNINVTMPTFGIYGSCPNIGAGFVGNVAAAGEGRICDAFVKNDPASYFHVDVPEGKALPAEMSWHFNDQEQSYFSSPFTPRVVVRTSRGIASATAGWVKAPSNADVQSKTAEAKGMNAACPKPAKPHGMSDFIPNWEDPNWGSFSATVVMEDWNGVGQVKLTNVRLRMPARNARSQSKVAQNLVLTADALVSAGGRVAFKVPVQLAVRALVQTSRGARATTVTRIAAPSVTEVHLASASLPRSVGGVSFALTLPLGTTLLPTQR
jgi:hypothetical protein